MDIEVYTTPPNLSTINGQVERFHSTLSEIMNCLKTDSNSLTFEDLLFKSVREFNSFNDKRKTRNHILWC